MFHNKWKYGMKFWYLPAPDRNGGSLDAFGQ